MRTHTFSGTTSREVLHKVKHALGDDALILSNRAVHGGIEVVALSASDARPAAAQPVHAPRVAEVLAAPAIAAAPEAPVVFAPPSAPAARDAQRAETIETAASGGSIDGILSEIQSLKTMLTKDMATFPVVETAASAPATATRTAMLREMLYAGFSPQLARRLAGVGAPAAESSAIDVVASRLQSALTFAAPDDVINRGGVYALVGPTGVGKTTTVAKLAARAVVRFGASQVALLTTDGYRIGAHDQLRIFGRILSVPVHVIRDSNDLASVLEMLKGRHLILIDTIGMSQRDRMVAEHAAMLSGTGDVKRLLLVPTTANIATLNQVVSAYKQSGVDGCILTKTDEAANLAPALDAVIHHELPIHYVTDGQRVPEDLQLPDAAALVMEALQPLGGDGFDLLPEEIALMTEPKRPAAAETPEKDQPLMRRVPTAPQASFPAALRPLHSQVVTGVVHG